MLHGYSESIFLLSGRITEIFLLGGVVERLNLGGGPAFAETMARRESAVARPECAEGQA